MSPSNLSGHETDIIAANPALVIGMKTIVMANTAAKIAGVKYFDSPNAIRKTRVPYDDSQK